MNNSILKNKTKPLFPNKCFLFSILAAAVLYTFLLASCASTVKTVSPVIPEAVLTGYVLEIDEKPEFILPLYYSDIISFPSDTGRFITYDGETGQYYVPGNVKAAAAGKENTLFEIVPVSIEEGKLSGFSCTAKNEVVYCSTEGNVYRNRKSSAGKWEEKKIFTADMQSGADKITAMAADEKNVYLFSREAAGIYRFTHSGKAEALIKLKYTAPDAKMEISAIDIKSGYLYLLFDSGLILLADYKERGVEAGFLPSDRDAMFTFFTVRQEGSSSDLLLARKAVKGIRSYSLFPLSSMHKMRIEDGFIKKTNPPVSGCAHVLTDSSGRIIFPVKSTLVNLDNVIPGFITVTGMIQDSDDGGKILVVSSVDRGSGS
ncbi:MAG: hypothetical protein H7A26_01755 [Spirochaetales bacterium]|nr:hypothetical protein [Spirochaetales bacterium]